MCFSVWNLQKYLRPLQKSSSGFLWGLTGAFTKELKTGATVSNKYQIQLKKSICCSEIPEEATLGVL